MKHSTLEQNMIKIKKNIDVCEREGGEREKQTDEFAKVGRGNGRGGEFV